MFRCVNPNLMRATCEWLGIHLVAADVRRLISDFGFRISDLKSRFRFIAVRAADVAFTSASDLGLRREYALLGFAICEEQIFFLHRAPGELFRERAVGQRSFAEDQHAAGFLVEPMDDGEVGPTRLAMFEPIVDAFASVGRRRVRVPTGGFVDDEQVLIFMDDAGWKRVGWCC